MGFWQLAKRNFLRIFKDNRGEVKWWSWPFDLEGEDKSLDQMSPSWQTNLQSELANLYSNAIKQYNPAATYGGKLSAGATPYENQSLDILSSYLNAPNTGELWGAGKQQILDTLGGKYANPETSPYIQSQNAYAQQQLQDQINQSRLGAGARGKYYSTSAMGDEMDLRERTGNYLNTIVGNFLQNERQNMLGAAKTAATMDEYETTTAPLAKVSAAQGFGSLNRILEQADLDRQYAEYTRQQGNLANSVSQSQGLATYQVPYGIMNWQGQSGLSSLVSAIPGIASILGTVFGVR